MNNFLILGVLPIMAYTGRLHLKGVPCTSLRSMRGQGFHYFEVHERVGKSVILVVESPKGLANAFYCCEKVEEIFWFCDLFIL